MTPFPPVPLPAPQFSSQSISVTDGGQTLTRQFLIHVPLRPIAQRTPMPAVIAFHGANQIAKDMALHWKSVIDHHEMVVVCPQGTTDATTNRTHWIDAGEGDTSVPTTDLAFVAALLDWLESTGDVDMDRVYASGFSNGAGMTWQLAMLNDFVKRFKGYAPVSSHGTQRAKLRLGDKAALETPKPLIYTHGTADDNWSTVAGGEQQMLPPDVVARWVARNHARHAGAPTVYFCPPAGNLPATDDSERLYRPIHPTAIEQIYLPDPNISHSKAVCFITILNGAHSWPLTGSDGSGRGLVCRDIDLTKRIIAFWNTYAGMGLPAPPNWRQC